MASTNRWELGACNHSKHHTLSTWVFLILTSLLPTLDKQFTVSGWSVLVWHSTDAPGDIQGFKVPSTGLLHRPPSNNIMKQKQKRRTTTTKKNTLIFSTAPAVYVLFPRELPNQKIASDRQECRVPRLQRISLQALTLLSAATGSQLAISDSGSRRRAWKIQTHEACQSAVWPNRAHLSAGGGSVQSGIRPQANRSLRDSTQPLANICQRHKTITLVCTALFLQKKARGSINYIKLWLRCSSSDIHIQIFLSDIQMGKSGESKHTI